MNQIFQLKIGSQIKSDVTMVILSRDYSVKNSRKLDERTELKDGPVQLLQNKISSGDLKSDEHQTKVMVDLQKLYDKIQSYSPPEMQSKSSFLKWLPIKSSKSNENMTPKGLYIYGSVGGGKTTLMDLFYNSCTSVFFFLCLMWTDDNRF